MGPAMPVNSVHGLCTAKAVVDTELIYMAARREPNRLRRFTFNFVSGVFRELPGVDNVDVRYAACGVAEFKSVHPYDGSYLYSSDEFVVVGGGARR